MKIRRIVKLTTAAGGLSALAMYGYFRYLILRRRGNPYPRPDNLVIEPSVDVMVNRHNGKIDIIWESKAEKVQIYAGGDPHTIGRDIPVAEVFGEHQASFPSALPNSPNTRPYFELVFNPGQSDQEKVIVADRILPIKNAVNFRDIGGYRTKDGQRVKWGKIYRSGYLAKLAPEERGYLEEMGIRRIYDLRTPKEAAENPDGFSPDSKMSYVHLPIVTDSESSGGVRQLLFNLNQLDQLVLTTYTKILIDQKARLFGDLLRRLAEPDNIPAVVHCTAGKDRTGISCALLLLCLGVPDEVVVADYSLSNLSFDYYREELKKDAGRLAVLRMTIDDILPLLTANPDTMRATIQYIRTKYSSVEAYLTEFAGLDEAVISQLRYNFLE